MSCPLFVELCAGTAAVSLRLAHPRARPPVSRMGAKTGYADVILRCLGLRPGQRAEHYLWCEPDPGVRLLLHAYTDRELALAAADIIRGWQDEEPRALWERLRAEGPAKCPPVDPREVARWSLVFGWAAHGKDIGSYGGPGRCGDKTCALTIEGAERRYVDAPTLPGHIHDDARTVDPREVARYALTGQWSFRRGDPESGFNAGLLKDRQPTISGGNGCKARTCEQEASLWSTVPQVPGLVHDDARTIDPPQLPPGTVAYADVPYQGTSGYAHAFPRAEWLPVVRRWRDAGALVCVSEAEPIPDLMAEGWHAVEITGERKGQKRTFGGTREWLTMSQKPHWTPSVQIDLWGNPINLSTGRG